MTAEFRHQDLLKDEWLGEFTFLFFHSVLSVPQNACTVLQASMSDEFCVSTAFGHSMLFYKEIKWGK